jgi:hypothetical protein
MMDELEDLSSKDYSGIYLENFTGRRVYCCYKRETLEEILS